MKLCFSINNLQAGGAERVFSSIVNWFAQNTCHAIYVLQFSYLRNKPEFYQLDNRVIKVFSFFQDVEEAISTLEKIKPDCIVSFLNPMNYIISLAVKRVKIPHIACERNNPYFSPPKESDRTNRDEAFIKANGCVFQTQNATSYFQRLQIQGLFRIIENPVCIKKQTSLNSLERENKIIAVGRYAEQKNYPILLQAYHQFRITHPNYRLDCYGKDSGKLSEIKEIANLNGWDEGVTFYDPIETLHDEIHTAKLFLMTSLYEGMPNALAEAGALGVPCVAVDVPGVRELVNRFHFGILCPKHDPVLIAKCMDKLTRDSELYYDLSLNGEKITEVLGVDKIAPLWMSFIEEVISRGRHHVV